MAEYRAADVDPQEPYLRYEEERIVHALSCVTPPPKAWPADVLGLLHEVHDVVLDHRNPVWIPALKWDPMLSLLLIPDEYRQEVLLLGRWGMVCPSQSQGAADPEFQRLLQQYRSTTRGAVVSLLSGQSSDLPLVPSDRPFPVALPRADGEDDSDGEGFEVPLAEVLAYLCQKHHEIPPLVGRDGLRPRGTSLPSVTLKNVTGWQVLLHLVLPFLRTTLGLPAPDYPFGHNQVSVAELHQRFESQVQQAYGQAARLLEHVMTEPVVPLRCADLLRAIWAVSDHWRWLRQWCEERTGRLTLSRDPRCLSTIGDVLRGYTRQVDALLNTYLRRGVNQVPLDVWYRLFVAPTPNPDAPSERRPPYHPSMDAELLQRMTQCQQGRRPSRLSDEPLEPFCLTTDDLDRFRLQLDQYFDQMAVRLTEPCYLFRRVNDWSHVSDPCTRAYTSTTRNWDLLPPVIYHQDAQVTYDYIDTDEKRAALQQWWQTQGLSLAQGPDLPSNLTAQCCFMVLRVAAGIPLAALGPGLSHYQEAEVLLPRHLTLTLRQTVSLCPDRDTNQQLIFFVEATPAAVAVGEAVSAAGKRKDLDSTAEATPSKFSATEQPCYMQ